MNVKPKHHGGYTTDHADLCERTLVTILRGLGPWKDGIYLAGGLVPRYLIDRPFGRRESGKPSHAGTTDVDLVLNLELLSTIEAYRRIEHNLKRMKLERGTNDDNRTQNFTWRRPVGSQMAVVVDLLCDVESEDGGAVVSLAGEKRLSALNIPGAHLVIRDHIPFDITAELLDEGGIVTETIRVAGITPFIVLKALAFEDRGEQKDSYDLIYSLENHVDGPTEVGRIFADRMRTWPNEPLLAEALRILRRRFLSDDHTEGHLKDGPVGYATFLSDPAKPDDNIRRRRDASAIVEAFLAEADR